MLFGHACSSGKQFGVVTAERMILLEPAGRWQDFLITYSSHRFGVAYSLVLERVWRKKSTHAAQAQHKLDKMHINGRAMTT